MSDMPVLTEEFKTRLVQQATKSFMQDRENRLLNPRKQRLFQRHYRRFESQNRDTLNFIVPEDMEFYEKSGDITAVYIDDAMHDEVLSFFKATNHPIANKFNKYMFLFVNGGNRCVPHVDDASKRKNSFQLLLKSGGTNTTTAYYEPRREYETLPIIDYCAIPYNKLDLQVQVRLEENNWYWMKTDKIHSVEGLESLRIFLVAIVTGLCDVEHLLEESSQ